MDCDLQDRGSSLQHKTTRLQKEKVDPSRESRSARLRDESGKGLKTRNPIERTRNDSEDSSSSSPSKNYQKPRSSKELRGEELVKHMSNVPCYLQRTEQDDVQQKALNFGVVNWRRLEKWAYDKNHTTYRRAGDSPSTDDSSFSFSTFGSSTQSCASIESSPVQRKKYSSNGSGIRQSRMSGEDKSRHDMGFHHDSSTSPNQHSEADCRARTDHKRCENGHGKKINTNSVTQPPDSRSTTPTPDEHGIDTVKMQDRSRSRKAEKLDRHKQQNDTKRSLSFTRDLPQYPELELSEGTQGVSHHLHESVGRRSSTVDSTFVDRRPVRVGRNSFSGNLLREDIQFDGASCSVPISCPLFSTNQSDEIERASTPATKIGAPIPKHKGNCEKYNKVIEESIVNKFDSLDLAKAGASKEISLNWAKRSASLQEVLVTEQRKSNAFPDNSCREKTTNNRSRSSPLRRILDPFLKSKSHISVPTVTSAINNIREPGRTTSIRVPEESTRRLGPSKSAAATVHFSTSQAKQSLNFSNQASVDFADTLQEETPIPRRRQALLQLTWKSDTPLLVLTSDDNHVLAATLIKKPISGKDNSECLYTISSLHEVKKKGGMWISQGNKSRKPGFISNIVGQLKVLSSKLISPDSVQREFVLIGPDLMQESHEPLRSSSNNELAAIIIKTELEATLATFGDALMNCNSSNCQESLQVGQNTTESSLSSITALLPVKVHGLPAEGQPSSLIGRWKSGGICDCGGWDEGCIPIVLIDKAQHSESSAATQALSRMDGTDQIELFIQGRTGEQRRAFKMVGCKEGAFTLEFDTSIAFLQAFAICVAILHNTKFSDPSLVQESIEASFHATTEGQVPTSYVPHHPPLSPVGRA